MTTLSDYTDELKASIAMDDDDSVTLMKRGVNAGLVVAALLHQPPELQATKSNVLTGNLGVPISFSTYLTRWLRIDTVYNDTQSRKVWFIDYPMWEVLKLPTSGEVQFYTVYGDTLYYKPTPSGVEELTISYLQYPARLVNDTDTVPLDMYQDFIISFATAYVWASKEETEDVDIWQNISSALNIPFETISSARKVLRREASVGDNIQRVLPASAS